MVRLVGTRTALLIKTALLFTPGVVVTDVPNVIADGQAPLVPGRRVRHEVVLLVSGVHNATLHALEYAKTLQADKLRAVHVSIETAESERLARDWDEWQPGLPLDVLESPFRDIEEPLLDYVRHLTTDGSTVVTIVLPEFIVSRWWHNLLHNQTALALKRIFLAEPSVVVTSVPYRLEVEGVRAQRSRRQRSAQRS